MSKSSSLENRVQSYLKPKYKALVVADTNNGAITESKVVADIVEQHYKQVEQQKNKSNLLSKHSY